MKKGPLVGWGFMYMYIYIYIIVNLIVQLATSTTLSIRCLQGQGQLQDDLRGLPCDQNLRCCRSPLVALQW